jgi:hypothetical protein
MALRSAALRVAARARCAASAAPCAPPRGHAALPAHHAPRRFAAAAGSRVLEVKSDAEYAAALSSAQGAQQLGCSACVCSPSDACGATRAPPPRRVAQAWWW